MPALPSAVFKTAQQDPTCAPQVPLHLRALGGGHGPVCCLSEHGSACWHHAKTQMLAGQFYSSALPMGKAGEYFDNQ